jgi:hypothetical protein
MKQQKIFIFTLLFMVFVLLFNEIDWYERHDETEIDPARFYHPIKNIETHQMLRDKLHIR